MLRLSLGFACNNACIFCAQGNLRSDGNLVDPTTWLAELVAGEAVAYVGGEPTLINDLPHWIRAAHDRGASAVVVQTNGRRLAYKNYALALHAASSRLTLDVSLHGSTAPMHDYHTSVSQSFAQTITGLSHARALGIPFAITTVITRSNFRNLAEIVRLANTLGAKAVQLSMAAAVGHAARARDRVIAAPELVAPYLAHALAEATSMGLATLAGDRKSHPDVTKWFAGIGEVEPVQMLQTATEAKTTIAPDGKRHLNLATQSRPLPARAEVRTNARRTGEDLRPLFPTLFEHAATEVG